MKMNTMKEAIGYGEFLKFAVDFNISSNQVKKRRRRGR
jgi:hypothetical protein